MTQPSTSIRTRSPLLKDGVILVNKPESWTSHDVVGKLRRITGTRRIGHLGTLDPLATGVLPCILNRATRLAQFFMRGDKRYTARIHFGHSTDTYDKQGAATSEEVPVTLDREQLEAALTQFRGVLQQMPPAISAKKIGGVPAYKLARKNLPVELKAVEVTLHLLDLLDLPAPNEAVFDIHCSAGTYVRSLAHDLGQLLGCGAYVEELTRTASGSFGIDQARTLAELEQMADDERLEESLIPAAALLPEMPSETVDSLTESQIRHGRDFRVSPFRVTRGTKYVKAISAAGELIAIGEVKLPNLYHPVLVL